MRDCYFSVYDCTPSELDELKMSLYSNADDFKEDFTEEEWNILSNCELPEEIPDSIVKRFFEGYSFVDEDFWCNMNEDLILEQNNGLI